MKTEKSGLFGSFSPMEHPVPNWNTAKGSDKEKQNFIIPPVICFAKGNIKKGNVQVTGSIIK